MRGLRSQENSKFKNFFELVQKEAEKQNRVFFLDCEEGNDKETETLELCNLSGWLLPMENADEFEKIWKKEEESDEWVDFFVFVKWENEKKPIIIFE